MPLLPKPDPMVIPYRMRVPRMIAIVKRNGQIVHYCTRYTPFRVPRPLDVLVLG